MARYEYDTEDDDLYDDDPESTSELEEFEDEEDDDQDTIPPITHPTGERAVDISMEIDENGNELWYAKDSRIPGSSSMGHSVEEAIDGVEERRRQYREMLKKSRERREER